GHLDARPSPQQRPKARRRGRVAVRATPVEAEIYRMKVNQPLLSFNRGVLSPLALARTDVKHTALAAEVQTNWMPRKLGSMMLRSGLQFVGGTFGGNAQAVNIPFVFSTSNTAILQLTNNILQVLVGEQFVTRGTVGTAISNGNFTSNITGWTAADDS